MIFRIAKWLNCYIAKEKNNNLTIEQFNNRGAKGLTLIELLISVFIITLLGTLSVSFYSRFLTQNSIDDTVNRLAGSFRKAQIYSMMGRQNSSWSVNYGGTPNTITLYLGTPFAGHNTAFDEKFSVSSNISVTGVTDVNFAKRTGLPNTTGTTNIIGNGQTKQITINSQGVTSK